MARGRTHRIITRPTERALRRLILLDTNILVGLCRSANWANRAIDKILQEGSPTPFMVSIVSVGEATALAHRNKWGDTKLQQLDSLFDTIPVIGIDDHRIALAFADMTNWTQARASSHLVSHPCPTPARAMRDNDLWIAATAHSVGATLVSTDKDFSHLKDIWFPFEYVSQSI